MSSCINYINYIKNQLTDLLPISPLEKLERRTQTTDDLSTRPHISKLIAFLAKSIGARIIIETGTFRGITAANLALANPDAKIYTFERDWNLIAEAKNLFRKMNLKNITLVEGNLLEELPKAVKKLETVDFAFIDDCKANYRQNFETILPKLRADGIVTAHDTSKIILDSDAAIQFKKYIQKRKDFSIIEVDVGVNETWSVGLTLAQKIAGGKK